MKLTAAALACLMAAAPLAGQSYDKKDKWLTYGLRASVAVPQYLGDRSSNDYNDGSIDDPLYRSIYGLGVGSALGLGAFAEWMLGRQVAMSVNADLLYFPGKSDDFKQNPGDSSYTKIPGRGASNILKVGADLVFRQEGLKHGPFYFAGFGIKKMSAAILKNTTKVSLKEEFGIVYFALGAGYDFNEFFGAEIRYQNMPLSFESYRYRIVSGDPDVIWVDRYPKMDINNIQVSARFRF